MKSFASTPELLALFQQQPYCSEQNESRALRCATRLGLTEKTLPTLGSYVQERRRTQNIPQSALAQQVGVDLQTLRELELNKLDTAKISLSLVNHLATALSESVDYLATLLRNAARPAAPRLGTMFTRITPPSDTPTEPES